MYAQVVDDEQGKTIASVSTLDKALRGKLRAGGNREAATQVGTALAKQALEAGVRAAQAGDKKLAQKLLTRVTELDPAREEAWLWLAGVTDSPEESRVYLQTVLALNPDNCRAQEGLQWLKRQHPPEARTAEKATAPQPEAPSSMSSSGELSPSFVLSVEQAEAIDACLERMAYESEARCIILADVTGQLIAERGWTGAMNTQVLSALAAGELAATNEMARLVGEKARCKLLLHEGESPSVYLSDVGEQLILVIVFDTDTPIGLVRMVLKQAVEELAPIIGSAGQEARRGQAHEALDGDFAQLLEDELDASLGAASTR
jgi:ribosomal protein L18